MANGFQNVARPRKLRVEMTPPTASTTRRRDHTPRSSKPPGWIDWVHDLMVAWGRWAVSVDDRGVGYPREVAFARLSPSSGVFESKLPSEVTSADIRDCTTAVDELMPQPKLVVSTYYKMGASRNAAADRLGCSRRLVTETVSTSHLHIAATLSRLSERRA